MRRYLSLILIAPALWAASSGSFRGRHYEGRGDVEYLELLDHSRRMFEADPEFLNVPMLYMPKWNGLVEGPTWGAWWVQNTYGTTYCALPFYREPVLTFLMNSHDLWFSQMGDGKREGCPGQRHSWVAPDGQLCDAAMPGCIIYKQGDGRVEIHDWGLEFTAAGLLLQAEALLIGRDRDQVAHYLPLLERSANFLETRRDPANNLFLAGPAANLLAPSYAGWRRPDGTYGQAYLAGLSVTYIAALDRLIELEKMTGATAKAELYGRRRMLARRGLEALFTGEGYLIKSLDPDGTRHGVFGAPRHGYFESSPNHDAICFRVVDQAGAERIYRQIAAIPELRPHGFILPNYPSLDDMYLPAEGLWRFGHWVNGGHWSTCEARMIMAYYRLGKHEDARLSMRQLMRFARLFRMDNPLIEFGNAVYQPNQPVNITYDAFGPPAAMIRGLFEYLYGAGGLRLIPHLPPGITELLQRDPVRLGNKRVYIAARGKGPVTAVLVNGRPWRQFDAESVTLPYADTPAVARVALGLGDGKPRDFKAPREEEVKVKDPRAARWVEFKQRLEAAGFGGGYEAAHAGLVAAAFGAAERRAELLAARKLAKLPEGSQAAADRLYVETAENLAAGLETEMKKYDASGEERKRRIAALLPQKPAQ